MQPTPQPGKSRYTSPWERRIAIGLLVIGLLLVLFFGARLLMFQIRIKQTGLQPGEQDVETIRGWMTVPYIAKAFDVPEDYLFQQIGIPQNGNQEKSLGQLNREYGQNQKGWAIEVVKAAIQRYWREHPPEGSDG